MTEGIWAFVIGYITMKIRQLRWKESTATFKQERGSGLHSEQNQSGRKPLGNKQIIESLILGRLVEAVEIM